MQQSPEVMNDLLHVPPPGALLTTGSFNQELWGFPKCLSRYSSTLLLLLPAHWAAFAPCALKHFPLLWLQPGRIWEGSGRQILLLPELQRALLLQFVKWHCEQPSFNSPCSRAALKSAQMGKYFPPCHLLQLEEDFSSSKSHQVTEPCTAQHQGGDTAPCEGELHVLGRVKGLLWSSTEINGVWPHKTGYGEY